MMDTVGNKVNKQNCLKRQCATNKTKYTYFYKGTDRDKENIVQVAAPEIAMIKIVAPRMVQAVADRAIQETE